MLPLNTAFNSEDLLVILQNGQGVIMMEQPSSSKQPDSSHDADNANTSESKPEDGKSEKEEIKTNPAIQKTKDDNSKKENDKTVTFSDTQIEISDTEDEDMTFGNRTNPRITISGPVTSPCEEKKPPCEEPAKGRCPIYYGIKSYIHDFYYPPDKEVLKSGEYIQEDDFQFLVEPGKRRWRGCWFRVGLWVGVNLMLVGIIAMLVGHMTAPRQTVVSQQDYTVVDRWAVNFNNRLIICQLAGLAGFTSGAVIVMLVLLVSSYQQDQSRSYYVMAATVVPETFVGNPLAGPKEGWGSHRIPLSGVVRGVQPCFHGTN